MSKNDIHIRMHFVISCAPLIPSIYIHHRWQTKPEKNQPIGTFYLFRKQTGIVQGKAVQPRQVKLLYVRNTKHTILYSKWLIIFHFNNKEAAFFNQVGSFRNFYHSFQQYKNSSNVCQNTTRPITGKYEITTIRARRHEFIDNKSLHQHLFLLNFQMVVTVSN